MKCTRVLLALVAMGMILGPFATTGWAQSEFYVCAQHGDDQGGDGSAEDPWASISHALGEIELSEEEPTAVIYVFEGHYWENVEMVSNIDLKGSYVHEEDDHTTGTRSLDDEPGDPSSIISSTLDILDTVIGANALLEGFVINNGSNGVYCSGVGGEISQNVISSNYISGIVCLDASTSIGHNTISNNNRHGIHIFGDRSAPIKIVGNEISQNANSGIYIDVDPSVSCTIGPTEEHEKENYIHHNEVSGILVARGSTGVEITDNRIRANRLCGICVCEESTPSIQNNLIEENIMTGISIAREGKGTNVSDNVIRLNVGHGILVQCTAEPYIRNNSIWWNQRDGIRFQGLVGSGIVAEENEILWNYGNGITCMDESSPSIVGGNIIAGNLGDGIYCDMKSKPIIEDAIIFANSRNGIVSSYFSEPTIERCRISSNLRHGVETKGMSLASLINNTISDNGENGLFCNDSSHPTIQNCIISGNNGYGIFEAESACDPAEVSHSSFYQNQEGDYRDENVFTYTGAAAINGSVNNRGNVVTGNIDGDPLFVAWDLFSPTTPIYVNVNTTSQIQDGTASEPFDLIIEALIQYDYRVAHGSPCIGTGQGGVDIGAYPDASTYWPKGSDAVGISVAGGNYYETNLVLNHNVAVNGNNGAMVIGSPLSREDLDELPEFLEEGSRFTIFYAETGSTIEAFSEIAEARVGVFVDRGFAPTIRDCTFVGNSDGIVCFRSAPLIQGNVFQQNLQENGVICKAASPRIVGNVFMDGQVGVLCEAGAVPEISSNTLTGHSIAGVLCREGSSPVVMTSLIQSNSGDGIYIEDFSAPIVKNTAIVDNDRNGINIVGNSTPIITGSEISRNSIYGIRCSTYASPTIAGNTVSYNVWDGIYIFDHSNPRIINNLIYRNRANGIYVEKYSAPEIINNTLVFNLTNGIFLSDHSTPIIRNTLLYFHRGYGICEYGEDSDPADFSNNCLSVSLKGHYLDEGLTIYWTGDDINNNVNNNGAPVADNINADDPRFVNVSADDFHLQSDSQCIDIGTANGAPATDFDGDVRPQGAGYDIGADEYTSGGGKTLALSLDESSWEFVTVPGAFSRPTGVASETGITIISTDNTNTFGYWYGVGHPVPIVSDCLYRFRFQVSTTLTDPSQVPALRLRLNTASGEQSDLLQISSGDTGSCSPTPTGVVYDLYAYPPQRSSTTSMGMDVFYVSFDVLNFDPSDAATAGVSLQGVEVSRIALSNLSGSQELRAYDFKTGSEQWRYSGTIAPFSAPLSGWASGCLQLRSTSNTDTFGFWSSDPGEVDLDTIAKLYRGVFTVSSDQVDRTKVACMRLRIGSEDGQAMVMKTISSPTPATQAPGPAASQYAVYFLPMQGILGSGLLSAFDMLNFDPTDNPQVTLSLDQVVVETLDIPTMP